MYNPKCEIERITRYMYAWMACMHACMREFRKSKEVFGRKSQEIRRRVCVCVCVHVGFVFDDRKVFVAMRFYLLSHQTYIYVCICSTHLFVCLTLYTYTRDNQDA